MSLQSVNKNAMERTVKKLSKPEAYSDLELQLLQKLAITQDQLRIARMEQRKTQNQIERVLVDLGFLSEEALKAFLAEFSGLETFCLSRTVIDAQVAELLPKDFCETYKVLLVAKDKDAVHLAMVDVHDIFTHDTVKRKLGVSTVHPLIISETELGNAIDLIHGYEMSIEGILKEIETGSATQKWHEEDVQSPTVRLVHAIIVDAVKKKASDIHFEPEGNMLRIRYRLDGILRLIRTLHISCWASICVRLKIISAMNIANARHPQSGRFSLRVGAREVDFRVSSQPVVHGENIVIRILDKLHSLMPLEGLGFGPENSKILRRALKMPAGLIVMTGPTGSGKTTTLYSMLNYINSPTMNIMTLEEPIEYKLPWIRQTEIKEEGSFTFAQGVRSILRQDPDVIFIGEVRDEETAAMALRAAMTGHQVYTTLHTNDVFGVVYRLRDLGLESSLLSGNMIAAVAQRLLRKLCEACKKPLSDKGSQGLAESLGIYEAHGCELCHYTGYAGRTAVGEILYFNEPINDLISAGATRQDYKKIARQNGFISMEEHGFSLVAAGVTSLGEFERVLGIHT